MRILNRAAAIGAWTMILAAIGHVVIVNGLMMHSNLVEWQPDLRKKLAETHISFGWAGANTFYKIFQGVSLGMALGVPCVGILSLMVLRYEKSGHPLRVASLWLNIILSSLFILIAATCFHWLAFAACFFALFAFWIGLRKEIRKQNVEKLN